MPEPTPEAKPLPSRRAVAEKWHLMTRQCEGGWKAPAGICWRCSMPATWHADRCHDCPPKPDAPLTPVSR